MGWVGHSPPCWQQKEQRPEDKGWKRKRVYRSVCDWGRSWGCGYTKQGPGVHQIRERDKATMLLTVHSGLYSEVNSRACTTHDSMHLLVDLFQLSASARKSRLRIILSRLIPTFSCHRQWHGRNELRHSINFLAKWVVLLMHNSPYMKQYFHALTWESTIEYTKNEMTQWISVCFSLREMNCESTTRENQRIVPALVNRLNKYRLNVEKSCHALTRNINFKHFKRYCYLATLERSGVQISQFRSPSAWYP